MNCSLRIALASAATLACTGCWGNLLQPNKLDPLITLAQIPAPDGGRLGLTPDGTLLHYPPLDDVDQALGCVLEDDPQGVRVTQQLLAEAILRPGDRILRAAPVRPDPWAEGSIATLTSAQTLALLDEAGHVVARVDDLRGYTRATTQLALLIEREGEQVPLRFMAGAPRVLPQQLWRPDLTRPIGFTACRLDTLFPEQAGDGTTLLVTWVAEGGKAALKGFRPLGLLVQSGSGEFSLTRAFMHVGPEATARVDPYEGFDLYGGANLLPNGLGKPGDPTQFDLLGGGMGVFCFQYDAVDELLVTVGPLGTCLTYKKASSFDPDYGDFVEASDWSTTGFSAGSRTYGKRGEGSAVQFLGALDSLATIDNDGDDGIFYFFPEDE